MSGAAATAPPRWALALAVWLMCAIWGSTWLVVREGLSDVPPLGGAALRFFIAWLALVPLAPALARREGGARPTRALVWSMAALNFAGTYAVVYWGEVRLPSALAAVLWSVYPLFLAVIGHVYVPGERLGARQVVGLALGSVGVVALFVTDLAALGDGEAVRGSGGAGLGLGAVAAIFLLGPLVSAAGTAHVKRHGGGVSSALLNRDGMLLGALLLGLGALVFERDEEWRFTAHGVACLLYLALFGTVVAFSLYFWALRHARATQLGLMSFVTPAIAVVLGAAVGGEAVTAWTWGGLGGILLGVAIARAGPRRKA